MSDLTAEGRRILKEQMRRAAELDVALLVCRVGGDGHKWTRCQPDRDPPAGQRLVVSQCDNCDGIRWVYFGAKYGEIITRHYRHAEGYMLHRKEGDVGPIMSPSAVRLTLDMVDREYPELRKV